MLKFLASVSPIAVLLAGAIPAGAIGWFSHGVKFELLDRPAIAQEATARADDAAAIRIMDAANRAEAAERIHQQAANAEALRLYREALANSQREAAETANQLEQEIADYEAKLAVEGRSCRLTDGDIEWLRDHSPASTDGSR